MEVQEWPEQRSPSPVAAAEHAAASASAEEATL